MGRVPRVLRGVRRVAVVLLSLLMGVGSKIESLDFCAISESESNVLPSSLSEKKDYDLSRTSFFFPSLLSPS